MPRDGLASWTAPWVAVDGSGRLYAATVPPTTSAFEYPQLPGVELRRYTASGAVDPTFGQGGEAYLPAESNATYRKAIEVKALWQSSSGEWNVAVRSIGYLSQPLVPPTRLEDATRLVRFLADGTPDPAFEQYTKLDDNGPGKITVLTDGRIVHATNVSSTPGCTIEATLGDQPAAGKMVEYYSATLDHYFMALEGAESVLLDTTPAGNGWARTGQAFGAWTPSQLGGTKRLCRFYGDAQSGPNSHFYTPEGAECDSLRALDNSTPKGQAAWRFEGYAANVSTPQGGICAANLSPVYRLYNRGFEKGGVPIHRYTPDTRTYADMQSKGWAGEGVAFCVPPIPNNGTSVYIYGS